jgi:hypothetical protein
MDLNWLKDINGVTIISIITNIGLFIKIIRDGKMLSRDIKGADLDNQNKEASLVKIYNEIAVSASEKMKELQESYSNLEKRFDVLQRKVDSQDILLLEYNENSVKQNKKIEYLECQISNYEKYNSMLIQQIRKEQLAPIEMKSVHLKNCEKILEA